MEHHIIQVGEEVTVKFTGKVTRIEGEYQDGMNRYFVQGGHCITAFVTGEQITDIEGRDE